MYETSYKIEILNILIVSSTLFKRFFYLCSIQTKGIQNAQNGNLQTFPLATTRLVFVKGLLIVNTVSSLMSFIKWRNSFKT